MNENDQELCLKEISGEVLDSGSTVNISKLSENWGISLNASACVIEKWLKTHGGDKVFFKQFLVRGLRDDGSMIMTIVPEHNLISLTKKLKKSLQMLYSIKEGTEAPAITISTLFDSKKKNLTLACSERESQFVVQESEEKPKPIVTKQEKSSAPPSPFTKPTTKVTNGHGSGNNNIANMFKNVKSEPKTPTKEQTQNNTQKSTPKKKSPNKKDAAKKNGSIGSFFSSKPQSQTEKKSSSIEETKKATIKEETDLQLTKSESTNGKRSSKSSDHSENDHKKSPEPSDNPAKRRKVEEKKKARSKGSRIMLMVDSDEEDEKPASKITSEDEEEEEPVKSPTPEKKTNGSLEPMSNGSKPGRAKKRRIVTKTYEDEDGFIRTVKESEEYSSSDAEESEPAVKEKKESIIIKPEPKKQVNTSPAKAKKAPAKTSKPPSKQGSIMSFFSKK